MGNNQSRLSPSSLLSLFGITLNQQSPDWSNLPILVRLLPSEHENVYNQTIGPIEFYKRSAKDINSPQVVARLWGAVMELPDDDDDTTPPLGTYTFELKVDNHRNGTWDTFEDDDELDYAHVRVSHQIGIVTFHYTTVMKVMDNEAQDNDEQK